LISIDSDEDMTSQPASAKRQKTNSGQAVRSSQTPVSTPRGPRIKREAPTKPSKAVFTLKEIRNKRDGGSASNLPNNVDPRVTEYFIKVAIRPWKEHTGAALRRISQLVQDMLQKCIAATIERRGPTALLTKTIAIVDTLCNMAFESEEQYINRFFECDIAKPVTYVSLSSKFEEVAAELEAKRTLERVNEHFETLATTNPNKDLVPEKRQEKAKNADWVRTTLGPDEYRAEATAMASPLAFYDHAANRLLDTVAVHIHNGFLTTIENELYDTLTLQIDTTDVQVCESLLEEDPEREARRITLLAEKQKLEQALAELQGLPTTH